jgi:hypothetical protein
MSSFNLLGAAAAVALLAAPALAIAGPDDSTNNQPVASAPATNDAATPSAQSSSANTSGTVLTGSEVTPAQAQALENGDNKLVSNGPVPDTPANRAKYGKPMSNAGKRTAPAGN